MTDWIPTLRPELLKVAELTTTPPGRLLYFRRGGRMDTFLAFGEEGRPTHWLRVGEPEPGRVYKAREARAERGLIVDVSDCLRVALRVGPPDPGRMMEYFGCIGVSILGPVYCGRLQEANFGGDSAAYLSLATWRRVAVDHEGWFNDTVWFSQWDLLYHDAETDERRKIFSSPHREA